MGNREGLLGRCCGNKHPGICCSHVATWFLKSPHEQQYNREDHQEGGRYLMRFVSTILALTLLAFCQSAVAATTSVYYSCVPTKSVELNKDSSREYAWDRFTIKVTATLDETKKTLETKSQGFLGNRTYEIQNFGGDDGIFTFYQWDAKFKGEFFFVRISFSKPNLFATYTSTGAAWGLHATCEPF